MSSDFLSVVARIVREQLYQLSIQKPMGPNGFHPRVLRELVGIIAGLLSTIFQRSWKTGEVPANWKLASFIPIYKRDTREDPENYRPVSLISVPQKVMEKIVLGRY